MEAAADLFAAKGDVSVRAIAERAGVNHGLVHHYFGGKAGLRTAVLDHLAAQQAARLESAPESPADRAALALRLSEEDERLWRILARALLDGAMPAQLQTAHPVVRGLIAAAAESADGEREGAEEEVRRVVAQGLAVTLGSLLFGPWISAATGLPEEEVATLRRDAMARLMSELEE